MKHLSLAALLTATSLFAATDAQIISFFKTQVPQNISVTVTSRTPAEEAAGYDFVVTTLSDGTKDQEVALFAKDGLAFPAIINLSSTTDAQIIDYFKAQVPENISVTVTSRTPAKEASDYDFVVTTLSDGTQAQEVVLFAKDGLIFSDVINLQAGTSLKETFEQEQLTQKLGVLYKKESKANIIALGNDKNKPTMVVFSDPECPACRNDLVTMEERLKTHNLRVMLTPVHDVTALQKSHLIYQQAAKAKTDKEKIAILKKYYDPNAVVDAEVSEEAVAKLDQMRRAYFRTGMRGVPFYVEEKELLK